MGKFVQKPVLKWVLEGDPVPVETRILELVMMHKDNPLRPTELLDLMCDHVPPYAEHKVRQALLMLLENDELEFTTDRKIVFRK